VPVPGGERDKSAGVTDNAGGFASVTVVKRSIAVVDRQKSAGNRRIAVGSMSIAGGDLSVAGGGLSVDGGNRDVDAARRDCGRRGEPLERAQPSSNTSSIKLFAALTWLGRGNGARLSVDTNVFNARGRRPYRHRTAQPRLNDAEQPVVPPTPRHRPCLPYVSIMAVGWAQDGAVQDQIDATVDSAVKRARSRLAQGESLLACEECGEAIPEARRQALPGVRRCVPCQSEADRLDVHQSLYNRRGSKDSQLR
jgi:phage/conjugal plasmid C-4 type zinc finger TraR family protein